MVKIRGIRLWLRNIHHAWIREIREIRVLLNIENLYSFGWISIKDLYEYNGQTNK